MGNIRMPISSFASHTKRESKEKGMIQMRNKETGFPYQHDNKFRAETARAKSKYASKRPDGTTNTHPEERMYASSHRDEE